MKPKEPESDCNQVKRRLREFLKKREEELSSTHENLQFIAVNQEGYYYSDEGLQGVWYRSKDLQDADIKSFLTTTASLARYIEGRSQHFGRCSGP